TFSGAILSEQPKALDFLPLLRRFRRRAMVKAYRFRDRREREMVVRLRLTVPGFAFSRPQTGRGKVGRPVVVSIVAGSSLLGIDPSFSFPPFDPDRDLFCCVIVVGLLRIDFRFELKRLLVMLECIFPIAQLFVSTLLCFAAFLERISKVIMTLALQAGIGREQSLAKGFQRFSIFFRLV